MIKKCETVYADGYLSWSLEELCLDTRSVAEPAIIQSLMYRYRNRGGTRSDEINEMENSLKRRAEQNYREKWVIINETLLSFT